MSNQKYRVAPKQVGAAVAAALLVGTATPVVLSPHAAVAAETGQIRVDLRAAVGEDWFAQIGDRKVDLVLIEGVLPRPDQLQALDIPRIKRESPQKLKTVATATTSNGLTAFTGIPTGVYLVSIADAAAPADKRVSYAPHVVAVTSQQPDQEIAPKAQQVGITVDPLSSCTTPQWRDAAAPGTYVEYDFVSTVPNLSTDGSLRQYELTLKFSPGHTVQWVDKGSLSVIALGGDLPTFETVAARTTITLAADAGTVGERKRVVDKLEAPRLSLRGAGETVRLTKDEHYTQVQRGNDEAVFAFTEQGLRELARLKALDPATTVQTWVPAKANDTAPWGSGPVRDAVLGDLEATATLLTDGMDASRTPVSVSHSNHINVVSRDKCFSAVSSETTSTPATATRRPFVPLPIPIPIPIPLPGRGGPTVTEAAPAPVTEVVTRETTSPDGSPTTVTETVTRGSGGSGSGGSGSGSESGTGDGSKRERSGGLAYTGAGVLGITAFAALLIALGIFLRRRDREDAEQ